ncbi:c-type cytochrome [Cyanobium sp. FGCU-52]|nr:c-type cytochrome [Cyanobium sp. FGCU52]
MASGAPAPSGLSDEPAGRFPWRVLVSVVLAMVLLLALFWPPPAFGLPPVGQASQGALGEELFTNHCAGCHVHGGNIIRRGRTLRLDALKRNGLADPAAIAVVAAAGRGQMSGYGDVLGPGGPEAVAAWVWEQAQQGWPRS